MAAKRKQAQASPPRPQFFKILLPGFSQGLRIPPQFNRYMEGEIPRKATILSPLGKSWLVEVHMAGNFLYFGEGWQKFSEAHDLDVGYLVLFRYEGDMAFAATVFDRSACMKEYMHGGGGNEVDENFYSYAGLKPSGCPRKRQCLHEQSPITERFDSTDAQKPHANFASSCTEGSQLEIKINSYNPCGQPSLPLPQEFIRYLRGQNSKLAILFSPSGESWCIRIDEDRKGIHFGDGWQRFAIAHSLRRGDSVVLKHKGALVFAIAIFNRGFRKTARNLDAVSGAGHEELPAPFHGGARMHEATDVKIHRGIRQIRSMKISRDANGELDTHLCARTAAELVKTGAYHRAGRSARIDRGRHIPKAVCSCIPGSQFTRTMSRRNLVGGARLDIPRAFLSSVDLSSVSRITLLDQRTGRQWPASVYRWQERMKQRVALVSGWKAFCTGNNVEVGDECVFKLASSLKHDVFHVSVIKRRTAAQLHVSGS